MRQLTAFDVVGVISQVNLYSVIDTSFYFSVFCSLTACNKGDIEVLFERFLGSASSGMFHVFPTR